jgi:hypothetical protein
MTTSVIKTIDNSSEKGYRITRIDDPSFTVEIRVTARNRSILGDDALAIITSGLQGFTGLTIEEVLEAIGEHEAYAQL